MPLIASIPLIAWYLPVQSPLILALVLVLGGLCLYRAGLDFPAGIVSSIGLFSPLGVLFVVYYLAKRAWLAVAGLAAGAVIWFVVLPAIYFGPQTALDESRGYVAEVIAPLPAQMLSEETISAADNYCVWAMLKRNIAGIDYLGEQAAKYGQSQNVTVSESNWILIIFVSLGVIMVFLALLGIWRKLNDRELTIVGLEGAELVLAYLLLAPYTPLGAYVVAIFALFAVVYAARATDVRKFIHHVNYVALILAGQCFYLAYLSEKARLAGAAFAGVFILWVAVLSAITQFRPHIVRGRRSVLAEGPRPREDKPIDLVNVKARGDEKEEKKEKETREGKGRKGIIPMPSFAWRKEKGEGTAGVETEPKSGDATPIELLPEDKPQEDKDKDEGASDKIKLE